MLRFTDIASGISAAGTVGALAVARALGTVGALVVLRALGAVILALTDTSCCANPEVCAAPRGVLA